MSGERGEIAAPVGPRLPPPAVFPCSHVGRQGCRPHRSPRGSGALRCPRRPTGRAGQNWRNGEWPQESQNSQKGEDVAVLSPPTRLTARQGVPTREQCPIPVVFYTTTRHFPVDLTRFTGSTGWEGLSWRERGVRVRYAKPIFSSVFTVRCSMFDVHSRKSTVKGKDRGLSC